MRNISSWIQFTALLVSAEAKLNRFHEDEDFSPKNAGLYHTEAFETLGNIYKNDLPQDETDVIMDMSNIMSSYCPEGDNTYHPHRVTLETFNTLQNGPVGITYPDDFDHDLQKNIDLTFSTVKKLNELNVDEIVKQLTLIQDDLDDFEVTKENKSYHALSLASVSIAIESTKLWHSAFYDPEHDLHAMIHQGTRRRLQFLDVSALLPSFDLTFIANADIYGAVAGGLAEINLNSTLFFLPVALVGKALLRSASYSAAAAYGGAMNMPV